ncbi:MAG: hypothetical protein A3F18_00965 [Legionellales bacterium RIFCSPHIGHO2_12_FULL_37_14]|nr:MAG: hypothetical protein A3F18_00965 [Legionellales bacterium RIFCSPHIGHO2_12_FULL_37_14]
MYKYLGLLLISTSLYANQPVGFLWYNQPKEPKPKKQKGIPFNQLSYTDKDAVLKFYTLESLHKVRFTHKLEDEKTFLALQAFWLKEASIHGEINQQALRYYPQYDFTITHPTSNIGTKLEDAKKRLEIRKYLKKLAKTHGLLFFYRGKHAFDQEQALIMQAFANQHHFTLLPVSIDRVKALPNTRFDKGEANKLGIKHFPAVLLIEPKTKKVLPVAFGVNTQDVLAERLFKIREKML